MVWNQVRGGFIQSPLPWTCYTELLCSKSTAMAKTETRAKSQTIKTFDVESCSWVIGIPSDLSFHSGCYPSSFPSQKHCRTRLHQKKSWIFVEHRVSFFLVYKKPIYAGAKHNLHTFKSLGFLGIGFGGKLKGEVEGWYNSHIEARKNKQRLPQRQTNGK